MQNANDAVLSDPAALAAPRILNAQFPIGHSPSLHGWAVLTAAATFVLIVAGALVTSLGVGMAVPDWPTTFGYTLFTFPWLDSAGGVFVEHGHRLLGATVGLLSIVLFGWLQRREPRPAVRAMGTAALGLVVLQGILGGLRVVERDPRFAIVHGGLAQAVFALMVALAVVTSRGWLEAGAAADGGTAARRVRGLALAAAAGAYLQVVLGAGVRHTGDLSLGFAHLGLAAGVACAVALATWEAGGARPETAALRGSARLLMGLLVAQVGLGMLAWATTFSGGLLLPVSRARIVFATAHVAAGALMLAAALALTLKAFRLGRRA